MTIELASKKWWTFLTFFSEFLIREFNLWCMGSIRGLAMLHRKWYERPSTKRPSTAEIDPQSRTPLKNEHEQTLIEV
jgi:hypothetical protein